MSVFIEITHCSQCPHEGHRGGFAKVSYIPVCNHGSKSKTIPYEVGESHGIITASIPENQKIPKWCPLSVTSTGMRVIK